MRRLAVLILLGVVLAACSDDTEGAATSTTTTTNPESTTTTLDEDESTTTTTSEPDDSCDDASPVPADAEGHETAPVDYDGDGDGEPDTLSVFRSGDEWRLHVGWAAGGTTATVIADAGPMGARPVGGYDLDGDGADEAFISIGGPAAGRIVGLYRTDGCSIVATVDAESGLAFSFPVTATVGTFSGATCDGLADLDLYTGELSDPDIGEYAVSQAPYTYDDGELTAEPGDAGSVTSDEVGEFSTLDCGALASAL